MEVKTAHASGRAPTAFGRIGVLMGGPSSEREISLRSGAAVYDSLKKQAFDVVALDIQTSDPGQVKDLLRASGIASAFIALHGRFGEDGQVQAILDDLGIRYTGSGRGASSRAMDKISAKSVFREYGLPTPRAATFDAASSAKGSAVCADFGLPWVIKPATHGSSIGLSIIESNDRLAEALKIAFSYDDRLLIEEYIKGRELTVGIIANRPLCVIEIVPKNKFFDFEAKYRKGMTDYIVPARLDEAVARKIQDTALAAHRALGCTGCSRADIILDPEGIPFVLEVNTVPGLTATSLLPKAAAVEGIDFDRLCAQLLESVYEKK